MTTPRRRILRPPATRPSGSRRQLDELLSRLETEQAVLRRWTSRLKRTFHAFEKQQARISRLEKRLAQSAE